MHEYDLITASHKHRKLSSVMVKVSDCYASDLGSLSCQVSYVFGNSFLVNSSNKTRIMKKLFCYCYTVPFLFLLPRVNSHPDSH